VGGKKIWKNVCNAGFGRKVEGEHADVCGDNGAAIREMDGYAGGDGANVGEGGIDGDIVPQLVMSAMLGC
jgi:hypothetical protein